MVVWSLSESDSPVAWWPWKRFLGAARLARRLAATLLAAIT
jgi:hypothetical protein